MGSFSPFEICCAFLTWNDFVKHWYKSFTSCEEYVPIFHSVNYFFKLPLRGDVHRQKKKKKKKKKTACIGCPLGYVKPPIHVNLSCLLCWTYFKAQLTCHDTPMFDKSPIKWRYHSKLMTGTFKAIKQII